MTTQQERAERIKAARSKSLRLIQMDSNGTLNKIAEGKRNDINNSINAPTDYSTQAQPQMRQPNPTREFNTSRMSQAAANVPSVIRESFQAHPPVSQNEITSSVLDDVFGDIIPKPKNTVNEEEARTEVRPAVQYASQIDYPMIRTIVEEIVRKYTSSLSKKMLNEGNKNEVNTIALGKTFKFLDSEGNIYECTMKKVSNINEVKKKNVI